MATPLRAAIACSRSVSVAFARSRSMRRSKRSSVRIPAGSSVAWTHVVASEMRELVKDDVAQLVAIECAAHPVGQKKRRTKNAVKGRTVDERRFDHDDLAANVQQRARFFDDVRCSGHNAAVESARDE